MDEMWARVAPVASRLLRDSPRSTHFAPVGLNSYLRCYRYLPGNVYLTHYDHARPCAVIGCDGNSFSWNREFESRHTILFYLNSAKDGHFTGGSTTLMPEGLEGIKIRVAPPSGAALVLPHGKHKLTLFSILKKESINWKIIAQEEYI